MFVKLESVPQILVQYIAEVLEPKVKGRGDLLSFEVGASKYLVPILASEKLQQYLPTLQALGLISESNLLDLTKLEAAAKSGLETSGKLEMFGYYFDEEDIASLMKIAKEYA